MELFAQTMKKLQSTETTEHGEKRKTHAMCPDETRGG